MIHRSQIPNLITAPLRAAHHYFDHSVHLHATQAAVGRQSLVYGDAFEEVGRECGLRILQGADVALRGIEGINSYAEHFLGKAQLVNLPADVQTLRAAGSCVFAVVRAVAATVTLLPKAVAYASGALVGLLVGLERAAWFSLSGQRLWEYPAPFFRAIRYADAEHLQELEGVAELMLRPFQEDKAKPAQYLLVAAAQAATTADGQVCLDTVLARFSQMRLTPGQAALAAHIVAKAFAAYAQHADASEPCAQDRLSMFYVAAMAAHCCGTQRMETLLQRLRADSVDTPDAYSLIDAMCARTSAAFARALGPRHYDLYAAALEQACVRAAQQLKVFYLARHHWDIVIPIDNWERHYMDAFRTLAGEKFTARLGPYQRTILDDLPDGEDARNATMAKLLLELPLPT